MDKNSDDILKEIPDENLLRLKLLYKKDWPYWIMTYYHLEEFTRMKLEHGAPIRFYTIDGNWDDGSFIAIIEYNKEKQGITLGSLDVHCERLFKALKQSKRIQWNNLPFLNCIHKDLYKYVLDATMYHNLEIKTHCSTNYYWLPSEEALKFNNTAPQGTYFSTLDSSHVDLINSNWPYMETIARQFVANQIKCNLNLGLFLKSTGELVCWGIRNYCGALSMVHTLDEHRRKGYATAVSKELCKIFAEHGYDIVVTIVTENENSKSLYKKLGFKLVNYISWLKLSYQ